jgi:predicted permease
MSYKQAMHALLEDIHFAWMHIQRSSRLPAFIVSLLAMGIGANIAVFSLLDALLFRPLPVQAPKELLRFVQIVPNLDARSNYPFRFYELMRQNSKMFSDVICSSDLSAVRDDAESASRIRCQVVSGNYFTSLGVSAIYGRVLTATDEFQVADSVPIVLSYAYWQRRFQGNPTIIGSQIRLQDSAFTIVGVMPRGFNGIQVETGPDVRAPLFAADLLERDSRIKPYHNRSFEVVGRMAPGTSPRQAEAEAQALLRVAIDAQGKTYRLDERLEARPIPRGNSILREKYSSALVLLMLGVVLLLLMICTNVGGLLSVQSFGRSQEAAIRLALGATPGRILREWLAESFCVSGLGSLAGLFVGWMLLPLLLRGLPPVRDLDTTALTLSLNPQFGMHLYFFAVGLCFLCALLPGLPAAVHAARSDLYSNLRSRFTYRHTLRWVLVGLQAGFCTLLLAGAALLVTTFRNLESVDPGFSRDKVVSFSADPTMLSYTWLQVESLKSRLLAAVRALPHVESAALSSVGIMRGTGVKTTVAPAGQRPTQSNFLNASLNTVTPEYLETMGILLVQGRNFRPDELAIKPVPVLVNNTFARKFFPQTDPVGQLFGVGLNQVVKGDFIIIGVVSDAKYRSLREPIAPTFYQLWDTARRMGFVLYVRTSGRPGAMIEPVRRALLAIDPRLPFYDVKTLSQEVRDSMWAEISLARISTLFSLAALCLALIAVYGTLRYTIEQGRRELAIRIALGARTLNVLSMNVMRPMAAIGIGIAAGLLCFYRTVPLFGTILFGISADNPMIVVFAAATVLLLGLVGSITASREALQIDPAVALRGE